MSLSPCSQRQSYVELPKENGQPAFSRIPLFADLIFNRKACLRPRGLGADRFLFFFSFRIVHFARQVIDHTLVADVSPFSRASFIFIAPSFPRPPRPYPIGGVTAAPLLAAQSVR